jgi:hypothetical protein
MNQCRVVRVRVDGWRLSGIGVPRLWVVIHKIVYTKPFKEAMRELRV